MAIVIDHIVLPARDNEASARFLAAILGVPYAGPDRHFAPVRVNDTFSVVFLTTPEVAALHLGFHIAEEDFDGILARLRARGIAFGNDPRDQTNGRTDHPFGGRGLFFLDPDGHLFEVMTRVHPR